MRLKGRIFTRDHSCSRSSCMRYFLCVLLCRCKPSNHSVYFPALQCQQEYSHFAFVYPRSLRTPSNLQENCTEGARCSHNQILSRQKLRMAHIARSLRKLFRRTVVRIRHRIFHICESKKVVHEHPQVDDILDICARNRANFKRVRPLLDNFNCQKSFASFLQTLYPVHSLSSKRIFLLAILKANDFSQVKTC